MDNEDFWKWMDTCPTHTWAVVQHEADYCLIIFPLEDEEKAR